MGPARSVCGHPEAVQLGRTDPGPGATEAPQPALPHTHPSQRACFSVSNSDLDLFSVYCLTTLLHLILQCRKQCRWTSQIIKSGFVEKCLVLKY